MLKDIANKNLFSRMLEKCGFTSNVDKEDKYGANLKEAEKILKAVEEKLGADEMYGWMDAFRFCQFMQALLVHDGGWVIDTGNYENVNYACACRLLENIKEHPKEWKELFMVG